MTRLAPFIETIHLGMIDDPHSDGMQVLSETVTVCPACKNINSLRPDIDVHCLSCEWQASGTNAN